MAFSEKLNFNKNHFHTFSCMNCILLYIIYSCVLPARQLKNIKKNTDSRPSILIHLVKDFELLLGSLGVFWEAAFLTRSRSKLPWSTDTHTVQCTMVHYVLFLSFILGRRHLAYTQIYFRMRVVYDRNHLFGLGPIPKLKSWP